MDEKTRALYAQFRANGTPAKWALSWARDYATRPEIDWGYDGTSTFEFAGLSFIAEVKYDEWSDKPWDNSDLGQFVTQGRMSHNGDGVEKSCGDMILSYDRGSGTTFDFRGAVRYLRKHGCSGKEANAHALTMAKHFKDWLDDRWHYVNVFVTLLDTDGEKTDESECVGGFENTDQNGCTDAALDMAREIASRVGSVDKLVRVTTMQIREAST